MYMFGTTNKKIIHWDKSNRTELHKQKGDATNEGTINFQSDRKYFHGSTSYGKDLHYISPLHPPTPFKIYMGAGGGGLSVIPNETKVP
jgi:hypothetical protein